MSLQTLGKGALRVAKNYTKGYSDVQAKVRDATSNDPWGPSGTQMNEIAQLTYNQNDFVEIMEMLDKRLNDKGKNWRHVFKALTLLDYCLHAGSENVVIYFRDNIYLVKTLKEFQYIDEYGKDQGANVRQKAKDITNLLQDESRLRQERRSRASMRDRMTRGGGGGDEERERSREDENVTRRGQQPQASSSRRNRDDDELKKALEESKKTFEKEAGKSVEDADLKRALELSEKEERERQKAAEDANERSLFDDSIQSNAASTTNPLPLVHTGLQPQYTIQPQFTSFNPYYQAQQEQMQMQWQQMQQQAQLQQLQQEHLAQQQAWELQQQQQLAQQQAWEQQQQQQQQQQQLLAQQQWILQQQQQQQQQPLVAQPTGFGSRNPFALSQGGSTSPPLPSSSPSVSLQIPNGNQQQQQIPSPVPSSASIGASQVKARPEENPQLAALFANRDGGVDTFGNFGNLRFGSSSAGKLLAANTGTPGANPAQNDQPFFSI